jgi:hypothetical protein
MRYFSLGDQRAFLHNLDPERADVSSWRMSAVRLDGRAGIYEKLISHLFLGRW